MQIMKIDQRKARQPRRRLAAGHEVQKENFLAALAAFGRTSSFGSALAEVSRPTLSRAAEPDRRGGVSALRLLLPLRGFVGVG